VPDTGNHRVQIFNPNGTYYATMGVTGESGTDNAHFNCPAGVAIRSSNGDIFVLDRCNQRVQVFDKNRKYKATIGVTGVSGSDNAHFNYPWGIAVDTSGTIYVGDSENHRVQKCNLTKTSYTCSTFAGVTGVSGSDYGHFAHPMGVAVDKSKNVYVVDEWNNRVQVFDSKGAYLTTIGGSWGPNTSQMRDPRGVAVDSKGNVYVTDWTNHRVQKFALGVPNWKQVNINGFGDAYSDTGRSLAVFGNYLYATSSSSSTGGIWRMSKSGTWTSVMANGFGVANNYIEYLFPFNGNLYATTQNQTSGGQVWRSSDGTAWNQVVTGGFGKATNWDVFRLAVFNNQIYAGTVSSDTMHGLEIWRSSTGNLNDWQQVVPDGFGDVNNSQVGAFVMFNNQLYVGTTNNTSGGELWRSSTGASGSWTQVNTDGFGSVYNRAISALAIYNGYLYAGTRNLHDGGEVWRSSDGTTWTRAASGGQGNVNNGRAYGLFVYKGKLYLVFANLVDGAEIWQTSNGTTWTSVMTGGWGNSNNGYADYWNAGTAIFNNRLYVGVINSAGGGEVWQYLK
jgi:hypothetical protein